MRSKLGGTGDIPTMSVMPLSTCKQVGSTPGCLFSCLEPVLRTLRLEEALHLDLSPALFLRTTWP